MNNDRRGIQLKQPGRHRVSSDFPAHWIGIEHGQNTDERSAAILRNVTTDTELRARGLDPARVAKRTAPSGISGHAAMARILALGKIPR